MVRVVVDMMLFVLRERCKNERRNWRIALRLLKALLPARKGRNYIQDINGVNELKERSQFSGVVIRAYTYSGARV